MAENQNPEQLARDNIDALLRQSGWVVQNKSQLYLNDGIGQAVREYQTDTGPADYILFIDRKPVGVIEAKAEHYGHKITTVEKQTAEYATAKLKWVKDNKPLPFLYESTGVNYPFYRWPRSKATFTGSVCLSPSRNLKVMVRPRLVLA